MLRLAGFVVLTEFGSHVLQQSLALWKIKKTPIHGENNNPFKSRILFADIFFLREFFCVVHHSRRSRFGFDLKFQPKKGTWKTKVAFPG